MHLSRVDLPDPLSPTRAKVPASGMSKVTSRSAQKSSWTERRPRMIALLRVWLRSWKMRNFFDTSCTLMAAPVLPAALRLAVVLTVPRPVPSRAA